MWNVWDYFSGWCAKTCFKSPKRYIMKKLKLGLFLKKWKYEVLFPHCQWAECRLWHGFHIYVCYPSHEGITHHWNFSLLYSVLKQKCQCGTEKPFQLEMWKSLNVEYKKGEDKGCLLTSEGFSLPFYFEILVWGHISALPFLFLLFTCASRTE